MIRACTICLSLTALVVLPASANEAASNPGVCAGCNFPEGWQLNTVLGSGYVSDSSFKFGDYFGLDDQGAFFDGQLTADYWSNSGYRWQIDGHDLGLEARALTVQGGRQGQYNLRLSYDKLPHSLFESGRTPFVNTGTGTLALPDTWLPAATTDAMTQLPSSVQPVGIRSRRETFDLGFSQVHSTRLEYNVDYQYMTKDGIGLFGGSFLNTASVLPRPIDHRMQSLRAGVNYGTQKWRFRLEYLGSRFHNVAPTLRWDNPFRAVTAGTEAGQAVLEPDNTSHQLSLSGQLQPRAHTHISSRIAVGRMSQNDALVPFTINPNLITPVPTDVLDASVDTLHLDLRAASRPTRKLRLTGSLTFDERENNTPSLLWPRIITDAVAGTSRLNLPYGYARTRIKIAADQRLSRSLKIYGGWRQDVQRRDFTEVDRTQEDELWSKLKLRLGRSADLSLRYAFADRDSSDYRAVDATQPPQNPLLQKYNLAGREREGAKFSLAVHPADRLDLGLNGEFQNDDYRNSAIGLTAADYQSVYVDAAIALSDGASITANAGYEKYHSIQRGSQSFALPDWQAENRDKITYAGLQLRLPELTDRLAARFGYTTTDTRGAITTNTAGLANAFPDMDTRLQRVELDLAYQWRKNLDVNFSWIYEDYTVADWSVDDVEVDTLPTVLGLGQRWLGYQVGVFQLSFAYTLPSAK